MATERPGTRNPFWIFDTKVRYAGAALDALLRLAGLEGEAERLRRSLRRL